MENIKNHKAIILLVILLDLVLTGYAQNVGIGTTAATRGRLVVEGAVGTTSAIFAAADGRGVSFQRNYPAIGFNHYFDGVQHRYLNSGKAMMHWLNHVSGELNLDLYNTTGTADAIASGPERVMTIGWNGNTSFNAGVANASLFVGYSASRYITRLQGTTYHSEFGNNFTKINGGKAGSNVIVGDVNSGYIRWPSKVGINRSPLSMLDIKQVNNRGMVLVEPSTFHNWEFVVYKNIAENASDLYVYYNGNYKGNFYNGDGWWYNYSDARMKTNVESLSAILPRLMQLRPAKYFMKNSSGQHQDKTLGFIAQEVAIVFPEIAEQVKEKETGYPGIDDLYSMNYDALAPVIIQGIKEQQQKITELVKRNKTMKAQIAQIEKMLSNENH